MGVEYNHFLFPQNRTFRPSISSVSQLIQRLSVTGFLPVQAMDDEPSFFCKIMPNTSQLAAAMQIPISEAGGKFIRENRGKLEKHEMDVTPPAEWFSRINQDSDMALTWDVSEDRIRDVKHPLEQPHPNIRDWDECGYYLHMVSTHDYDDLALNELMGMIEPDCTCGTALKYDVPGDLCVGSMELIAFRCVRCGKEFDPSTIPSWVTLWNSNTRVPFLGGGLTRFYIRVDVMKAIPEAPPSFQPAIVQACEEMFGTPFIQAGEIG